MKPVKLRDAAFLHAETAATPMHVGALFVLDLPAGRARRDFFERLRATVAARLGASEVFTRTLATLPLEVANPMWVTTPEVDLDHHVRRSVLPRPGTRRQLENRVAMLHEPLLDRSRPLWELHLVEGLAGDQAALYMKVHHAGLDGYSAQLFVRSFVDGTARPRPAARVAPLPGADDASTLRLVAAGLRHQLGELGRLPRQLVTVAAAAAQLARGREAGTPAIPRTVLNEAVSGRRRFATTVLPLEAARRIAHRAGGTVNDVVLAVTAGALRRWLLQRGILPAQPLFAGVPASTRADGDAEHAIRVAFIPVSLHTDLADPQARLAAIHESATAAKQSAAAYESLVPDDAPSLGLPWLLRGLTSIVGHPDITDRVPLPFNVVVSNVPGPAAPVYVAGARVTTCLPISVVFHGVGLNLSVCSYDGGLFAGITACADLMPDADRFARYVDAEFAALAPAAAGPALSRASSAPRRGRPRRR